MRCYEERDLRGSKQPSPSISCNGRNMSAVWWTPKIILFSELKLGTRIRGAPKCRYYDQMKKTMTLFGINQKTWEHSASHCPTWKKISSSGINKLEEDWRWNNEERRRWRKERLQNLQPAQISCPHCPRLFWSYLGVNSHHKYCHCCLLCTTPGALANQGGFGCADARLPATIDGHVLTPWQRQPGFGLKYFDTQQKSWCHWFSQDSRASEGHQELFLKHTDDDDDEHNSDFCLIWSQTHTVSLWRRDVLKLNRSSWRWRETTHLSYLF